MDKNGKKTFDDMTIKEALFADISRVALKGRIIVDPAPLHFIPITPLVIGKKAIKGAKHIFGKK